MCWLQCALRNNTYNLLTMNLYILDDPDLQHCWHIVAFMLWLEIQGAEHCNFTSVLIIRPKMSGCLSPALEALWVYMGPHFMSLLSIYALYSNVTYIYISCIMSCGNKIVSNCLNLFGMECLAPARARVCRRVMGVAMHGCGVEWKWTKWMTPNSMWRN